jgi:hypothetical protein
VDRHPRRLEAAKRNFLFDPQDDVVAGATLVVPKVVIETQLHDATGFQKLDRLIRPVDTHPSFGCWSLVIEKHTHGERSAVNEVVEKPSGESAALARALQG